MRFLDNTTLSGLKDCPRYYYLRHVKNITGVGTKASLVFGSSWHSAMDTLYAKYATMLSVDDLVQESLDAFMMKWVEEGLPAELTVDQVAALSPRVPGVAKEMLYQYISKRSNILDEFEVVAIEQPFAVPVYPNDDELWYCGRLDKVGVLGSKKLVIEHKTSSEYKVDGGFKSTFIDQFGINSQTDGYLFGGNLFLEGVDQVWIDGALVHAKVHDVFKFIPISRSMAALDSWLTEMRMWTEDLLRREERFKTTQDVVASFPRNTQSCIGKYGKCQFYDICHQYPKADFTGIPEGFKEQVWAPFDTLGLSKLFPEEKGGVK